MSVRDVDVVAIMAYALPDLRDDQQLVVFTIKGDREAATTKSVEEHYELMHSVLSKYPTRSPCRSTLMKVLREYKGRRKYCGLPSGWITDETDKLHKLWRYVYANFKRTSHSRSKAMRDLKRLLAQLCTDDSNSDSDTMVNISDSDGGEVDAAITPSPCTSGPRTLIRTISVASSTPPSPCRQPMSSSLLSECPTATRPSKSRMDSSSVKTKNKNKNKKDKTDSAASSTATPAPTAGDKKRATPTRLTCKTCIAAEHLPLRPHGPSITKTVPLNTGCDKVTLRNLQLLTGTLEVHENPALAADIKITDMVQRGQWIHQFKRGSDQIVCQVTQHKFGEYFFQASALVLNSMLRGYSAESIALFKKHLLHLGAD